ncbi:hypothetical protein PF005_g5751 [Phytophthora fragariae]|uniref:Uncharacterized protein n=1 Tax=Phytophthora fragariae TaxID=53985 RepID=A0A6A3M0A9_9STRA|nr:hypothetical protein PF003_g39790 [Phytophthora fragariae]KAE8943983.1 hypothetical protein PF009_g6321 [Phytophthora fragariae]KAE9021623.1 hypothetical protein PF011_g4864 [Phytophthora fragariae]KAE9109585.1 hypothetical protein PF010_g11492 [Phytophthora fragariae]KAE9126939.1 hypothetical protein PF007_g5803 [Phytophthora fragariae]
METMEAIFTAFLALIFVTVSDVTPPFPERFVLPAGTLSIIGKHWCAGNHLCGH